MISDFVLKNNFEELRQSPGWAGYLEFVGWNCIRTSRDINIAWMKSVIGCVSKIQRPGSLTLKDLNEIEKICKSKKALFIKIEPSLGQDEKVLENFGYKKSYIPLLPPSTILINLKKTEKELFDDVSHSGRYSLNRSNREGVTIDFHQNPSEKIIKKFWELASETSQKKKFGNVSLKDLTKKVELFGNESFIISAKNGQGETTVANFYLGYKNSIWYVHGGTSEKGRKSKDGYKLVWESFLYFKKLGYLTLDLEGVQDKRFPTFTKSWGGFTHFKEKFSQEKIEYPQPYIKLLNPVLKVLEKIYGRVPL
ncbi:hypothetical protein HYV31_02600 [candidate division WWE3 bacterium]|nr:hypothetical protein [candidate division WWE3 bacterium]